MKKILTTILCLQLLAGCSESIKVFDCDGVGLTISGEKLSYGPIEYSYCKKQGNWSMYSTGECNKTDIPLFFDEITHRVTTFNVNGISGEKKCILKK